MLSSCRASVAGGCERRIGTIKGRGRGKPWALALWLMLGASADVIVQVPNQTLDIHSHIEPRWRRPLVRIHVKHLGDSNNLKVPSRRRIPTHCRDPAA
jgi:hypothetical protein